MRGAVLLEAFGAGDAAQWREFAAQIAARFRAASWVSDARGGYPALALDAAKRPVDAVTSNIGHLLGTGMLTPRRKPSSRTGWARPTWTPASACARCPRAAAATTR